MYKLLLATPTITLGAMGVSGCSCEAQRPQQKPNIIWYLIEDTSPQFLGLYNNGVGAPMPNLERFANDAITYTNAFSSAPVSSAARTTLITSCYAPRFAGSFHRRLEDIALPENLSMFPSYLRQAGYYTCNAKKEDYNVILDPECWSQRNAQLGDWRKRDDKDQPFFFMRSNMVTHENQYLFNEETYKTVECKTSKDSVNILPYNPDTDLMRYTYATFYDRLKSADDEFAKMLDMLREDGLMENTFIFFFGDNGGVMPGSKGYTTDTGLRVPLVVYIPKPWREYIALESGKKCDAMISFIDFGATVLDLAGIELPSQIDGTPFLSPSSNDGHQSIVCYGDRFDELYAFNRVLYRDNLCYSRNYTSYQPKGLHTFYRYRSLAFQQWREMYHHNELNNYQANFFEPQTAEELYDNTADPAHAHNLVDDPNYAEALTSMRAELAKYVVNHNDLGFYPENILMDQGLPNLDSFGKTHSAEIKRYQEVADLELEDYNSAEPKIMAALASNDKVEQWWAITTAATFGKEQSEGVSEAITAIFETSTNGYITSRAMLNLSRIGKHKINTAEVKKITKSCTSLAETLIVLNDLTLLSEQNLLPKMTFTQEDFNFIDKAGSVKERIKYLNAIGR